MAHAFKSKTKKRKNISFTRALSKLLCVFVFHQMADCHSKWPSTLFTVPTCQSDNVGLHERKGRLLGVVYGSLFFFFPVDPVAQFYAFFSPPSLIAGGEFLNFYLVALIGPSLSSGRDCLNCSRLITTARIHCQGRQRKDVFTSSLFFFFCRLTLNLLQGLLYIESSPLSVTSFVSLLS